jgi:hypothetical protein
MLSLRLHTCRDNRGHARIARKRTSLNKGLSSASAGPGRRAAAAALGVKQDRGSVVQITVRDEVVAELRAALPEPEPGAAAQALLELMRKLPKHRGPRWNISLSSRFVPPQRTLAGS